MMNKALVYIKVMIVLIMTLPCEAQDIDYTHEVLTVADGLAANEVLCGWQAKSGFLWFGSRNGLNRYDGKHFSLLTKRDGLQANRVVGLAEDGGGNIWINYGHLEGTTKTDGKIDVYNPISGTLNPLNEKNTDLPFKIEEISLMLPTADLDIYFLINNAEVFRYNTESDFEKVSDLVELYKYANLSHIQEGIYNWLQFNRIPLTEKLTLFVERINYSNRLRYINAGDEKVLIHSKNSIQGSILIEESVNEGISIRDTFQSDRQTYDHLQNIHSSSIQVNDPFNEGLFVKNEDDAFIVKEHKAYKLFPAGGDVQQLHGTHNFISDNQGNYWLCTQEGLHKFSRRPDVFTQRFTKELFPTIRDIRGIYADASGNIWTSSLNDGIAYYNATTNQYSSIYGPTGMLLEYDPMAHQLWVIGNGNYYNIDLENHTGAQDSPHLKPLKIDDANTASYDIYWSAHLYKNNQVLLGDMNGQIQLWDLRDGLRTLAPCSSVIPYGGDIYRIINDGAGNGYWTVGTSGCYHISSELCVEAYYGSGDHVNDEHQLPVTDFRDIHEDANGIFWLATNGDGLLRWDRANHTFQLFTIQDGMPSNTLYRIIEDEYDNLWISTDNGLARFNKATNIINSYSQKDGISHNEFNRVSSFKAEDGRLYFGGIDGLTSFHPKDFISDSLSQSLPIRVTHFRQFLNDEDALVDRTHDLLQEGKIVLAPGDGFFRLEFALLDFDASPKKYRYRIEGFNEEYLYLDEGSLQVSGLPYGKYELTIEGQSRSGIWSDQQLLIPIVVVKPFYLRWWMFLIYALSFASFLYVFRNHQINKALEKAKHQQLQEIDELKTKLYSNITHEFRTPLTVIMGMANEITEQNLSFHQDDQLESKQENKHFQKIKRSSNFILRNAQSLLELVNQILDLSKLEKTKMNVNWELGDITFFLKYISESFHSLAETKLIRLNYNSEVESLKMDYDKQKVQKIVSNLLSNAIKNTPENGQIHFSIKKIEDDEMYPQGMLQVSVTNSGAGIPEDQLTLIFDRFYQVDNTMTRGGGGTGIGLALTKELVELMGGNIIAENNYKNDAVFTLKLPIHCNAIPAEKAISEEHVAKLAGGIVIDPISVPIEPEKGAIALPLLLVVEDNHDVASYIRICLEDKYQIVWAENGQKGIDMAIELIPDIIISDVMMPEKDGFEVTQCLKNDERTSHIPIILLTAKSSTQSRLEGLERGADAYLTKPFLKKELLVRVENLIELRGKMQAYFGMPVAAPVKGEIAPSLSKTESKDIEIENTFLNKVHDIFDKELANVAYNVPSLGTDVGMSYSQVYRKIKALTGQSIVAYLRSYRLSKGHEMIKNTNLNISEIAYNVGFSDPSYFTKVYAEKYGPVPTEARG